VSIPGVPREAGLHPTRWSLAVLAGYSVFSVIVFGWRLWPHPGRGVVGLSLVADPEAFIWEFGWWAHAIETWTNPFVTDVVYAPVGANLMWTATGPGLALVFAPLTMLIGPTAAYNAAILLTPALTAWTAFLLCRDLSRSMWASAVAGYLFGFSSYAIAHVYAGDLNLTTALVPLVALVLLRYLRGQLGNRGLAWRLGGLIAVEFVVSSELTLTLSLAIGAGLLIGYGVARGYRKRIVSALVPIGSAYVGAALLAAPFVYYLVSGFESENIARGGDGDLLNILLPTKLIAAGGSTFAHVTDRFTDTVIDADMYVGIPTLVILALYLWRGRREPAGRFLGIAIVVAWILAIGPALRVEGHRIAPLPWALAKHIGLLADVIETRLTVYATLAVSVAVALWTATTRGRLLTRPVVLPLLAIASILPAAWHVAFVSTIVRPEFFSQALYKLCIPRGETLAIFPYGRFGDSMIYQAESGFWFKIAEGNLGRDEYPAKFVFADRTIEQLQFYWYGPGPRPTMLQLKKNFATRFHVDRMVSVIGAGTSYPSTTQMHAFGPLQVIGGVAVAPACGYDSLAGDTRRIQGQ
jgi:hypothetical protein